MKILLLLHVFIGDRNMHGVGVMVYEEARGLIARGHTPVIVDRLYGADFGIDCKEYKGIRYYTVKSPVPEKFALCDHQYNEDRITTLLDEICNLEQAFDVAHIHHLMAWPSNVISLLKSKNVPVVASVHDTWYICPAINYYNRVHQKTCAPDIRTENNCTSCLKNLNQERFNEDISLSWLQTQILEPRGDYSKILMEADAVGFPSIKCRDLYLGESFSHPLTEIIPSIIETQPINVAHPHVVFGFIGNPTYGKGLETLLAAFSGVTGDIRLNIYGATHDTATQALLSSINDTRISYMGFYDISELDTVLSGIDIVVVPSIIPESFNICSYVAVRSMKKLIVSDIAVHGEFLLDGSNCVKFSAGDVESLRGAIAEVMKNPLGEVPGTLPPAGLCYTERYLNLFNSLLARRNTRIPATLVFIAENPHDLEYLSSLSFMFNEIAIVANFVVDRSGIDASTFFGITLDNIQAALGQRSVVMKKSDITYQTLRRAWLESQRRDWAYVQFDGLIHSSGDSILIINNISHELSNLINYLIQK